MSTIIGLPNFQYNILTYLADNADPAFWKLLKYKTPYALEGEELTRDEKLDLIYIDELNDSTCIFLSPLIPGVVYEDSAIVKIYTFDAWPYSATATHFRIAIDLITGLHCSTVYNAAGNPVARVDLLLYYLLDALNDKQIGGIGTLSITGKRQNNTSISSFIAEPRFFNGLRVIFDTICDVSGGCDCE